MNAFDLAEKFDQIASLLEIKGEVIYKTIAYRKAAESLRNLPEDIETIHKEGRLQEIPGVGKAIAEKIAELLETGHLKFLDELTAEIPPTLAELLEVPDVGPKKALLFYKEAGITNLAELEAAATQGKLDHLPGVGQKSVRRILAGIEALSRRSTRQSIGTAMPIAERWVAWLLKQPGVKAADFAGSLRRWRATIGDLDLVAAADQPEAVMEAFIHHPEVRQVNGSGDAKSSIVTHGGLNIQLWVQPPDRYGSLLQFVTGSKEHNVHLRELALKSKRSLSEKGLLADDGSEEIFSSEEELYRSLGLDWIPPEMREDRGEIDAAKKHKLPRLIETGDLQSEFHAHTTWSDGSLSILQMAEAARKRGLKVLAITDHSSGLGIAGGLNAERLLEQRKAIDEAQSKLGDSIRLLQGTEMEIRADGTLDFPDEVLAKLDIVIASLHVSLRQPRADVTARLVNAIRNPHVDIIGHPSGRLLPNREGADLDWEEVFKAAKESGIALEINASPQRLDLDEVYARRAAEMGIPLTINTDAHSADNLDLARYGVSVARRAWVQSEQVINTWPTDRLLKWLSGRGGR